MNDNNKTGLSPEDRAMVQYVSDALKRGPDTDETIVQCVERLMREFREKVSNPLEEDK